MDSSHTASSTVSAVSPPPSPPKSMEGSIIRIITGRSRNATTTIMTLPMTFLPSHARPAAIPYGPNAAPLEAPASAFPALIAPFTAPAACAVCSSPLFSFCGSVAITLYPFFSGSAGVSVQFPLCTGFHYFHPYTVFSLRHPVASAYTT